MCISTSKAGEEHESCPHPSTPDVSRHGSPPKQTITLNPLHTPGDIQPSLLLDGRDKTMWGFQHQKEEGAVLAG